MHPFPATILSYLLHPLLLPTLLSFAVMHYQPELLLPLTRPVFPGMLLAIFLTSFCVPALTSILLYQLKVISSVTMKSRRDRVIMMGITSAIYFTTGYLLFVKTTLDIGFIFLWGALTATVLITAGITWFWKISAHSAGAGGMTGYFMALAYLGYDVVFPLSGVLVLAGALIAGRLCLQAHTLSQVTAGFGMGWAISFVTVYYFVF